MVATLLIASCSNNKDAQKAEKKRRANIEDSSNTKKTLPALSSTTTTFGQSTTPVASIPYTEPKQISSKWNSSTLCKLVSAEKAKSILAMATIPVPKYSFSETTGARCTYSSGAGDELYIELSATSYIDARSVDTALNAQGTGVVVSGVGGVVKTNKATGTTYELNVSGDNANEWVANASTKEKAQKLAEILVGSLT